MNTRGSSKRFKLRRTNGPGKISQSVPKQSSENGMLFRLRGWAKWLNDPMGGLRPAGGADEHRLPRWFLLFLGMFGLGMILISLIGDQGVIAYYELRGEYETLKKDVAGMGVKKTELNREIKALREDADTIEHLARKYHGLVKPGDVVLQLPSNASKP